MRNDFVAGFVSGTGVGQSKGIITNKMAIARWILTTGWVAQRRRNCDHQTCIAKVYIVSGFNTSRDVPVSAPLEGLTSAK
jgi:hypothetical protein